MHTCMTLGTTCEEIIRHYSHRDRSSSGGMREVFVKSAIEALEELHKAGNEAENKWEWPSEEANKR